MENDTQNDVPLIAFQAKQSFASQAKQSFASGGKPVSQTGVGRGGSVVVRLEQLIAQSLGLLIYGNAGSGKSHALRGLLEQTAGFVQHIVFDSEGEFATLRSKFDYLLAARGDNGDVRLSVETATVLCQKVMETGVSVILDISDLKPEQRIEYVAAFVTQLVETPLAHRRPVLVAIDEVHRFAPQGGKAIPSRAAIADLVALGRKRGLIPVLATQRIAKADKDALAEIPNKLVGRITLDVDVDRAADDLGLRKEDYARLKTMQRGTFFALGPLLADSVTLVRTGDNETRPPQISENGFSPVGTEVSAPATPAAIRQLLEHFANLPEVAEEEVRTLEEAKKRIAAMQQRLSERPKEVQRIEVPVEVPVLEPGQIEQARALADAMMETAKDLTAAAAELRVRLDRISASPPGNIKTKLLTTGAATTELCSQTRFGRAEEESAGAETPYPEPLTTSVTPRRAKSDTNPAKKSERSDNGGSGGGAGISAQQQDLLNALADFEALRMPSVLRSNLAVWVGVSSKSSGFSNNLGRLRTLGLVDYPEGRKVALTAAGRQLARPASIAPSRRTLIPQWKQQLSGPQGDILDALLRSHPAALGRNELAERVGVSVKSSGFSNNLGRLRSLDLIDYPGPGMVALTGLLFPDGLPE